MRLRGGSCLKRFTMGWNTIIDDLLKDLRPLHFGPPVTHVYNSLEYAREPYEQYLSRYGTPPKEVVFLGMNPGPWGMAQTGVPFGDVEMVKEWLQIEAPVGTPPDVHPKRPVQGFSCPRSEVSASGRMMQSTILTERNVSQHNRLTTP